MAFSQPKVHWVTDIFEFSELQTTVLEALNKLKSKIGYINKPIYRSLVETEFFLTDQLPVELQQKIDRLRFYPISLVLHSDKLLAYRIDQGLRSVITALVKQILRLEVLHIVRTDFIQPPIVSQQFRRKVSYQLSYMPYIKSDTEDPQPIYLKPEYSGLFRKVCNLDNFVGVEVYSQDPIAKFTLTNLEFELEQVYQINQLILGPVVPEFDLLKAEVATRTAIYRSDFHFYLPIDNCNYDYTWLTPELASMWEMEEIFTDSRGQVYRSELDPGMDLESWFEDSTLQIWRDRLPVLLIPTYQLKDDFEERNVVNRLITLAKAVRAYSQLVTENPTLARAIFGVKVTENQLISMPVTTELDRKIFVNRYQTEFGTSLVWNVKIVKSFLEGILTRYLMQKQGLTSFLFELAGVERVVYTTPDPSTVSKEYSADDYSVALVELRADILAVYKHCVNADQLAELSLLELLTVIEVIDDPESGSYCFTTIELTSLNLPVNPITRIPLSEYVIAKTKHIEYGIRGYFSIGVLEGVYTTYPKREILTVTTGDIETQSHTLASDNFISVCLKRPITLEPKISTHNHLFDIMLDPEFETTIKQAVTNLWRAGYLLSTWGQSLYLTHKRISVKPIRDWPILDQAVDSKLHGSLAMAFIQRAEHELH